MLYFPSLFSHTLKMSPSKIDFYTKGYYQNCRGLRTKLKNLKCNIVPFDYTYIVLTETWLNDTFFDNELGFSNYNIYRFDRCPVTNHCS